MSVYPAENSFHLQVGSREDFEALNEICRTKCNARCCRMGVYVRLLSSEYSKLNRLATMLKVDVKLSLDSEKRFIMSHNVICGFLDQRTNQCRIYEDRPQDCRIFVCEGGAAHIKPRS